MTLHASTGLLPPSNTTFQAIGDALPCAVIQLQFPDSAELASTCSFVAGRFEGLTGISREAQLLNPHAFEKHVIAADQSALRAWMKESLSAARLCLPLAHETHIRLALTIDGELRHLLLNCACQADAHGVTMTGYFQKSSPADSISAAQDAHQRLLDAMPIPAYVLDASGIYICVNRAFEDAFGLAPNAVLGKDTGKIELFHVMQRHKFKMDQMAVLSSGTALQSLRETEPAKRARRKDLFFESCMYRADGIVDGLIGIAIDVQESAEAQRKLTALQNHMRTVLESAPSALIISDQDGQVLFNNERALTVFRVDAQRLRSEGVALCDAGPAHRPSSIEFGGLGGAFTGMEIERKRGDGSVFWARVASSVGDFGGQQATFTWTDDISERRAAADALLAAKESAESAAATKSAFLANMSHEIRTPMNAIIGLAHLALRTKLTTQQRDYVQKVHGAGQNLLGIINDILDFSKIEAGKLEVESIAFNLDEVLTQVSTVTSSKAWDKGLELLFEVPGDVPRSLVSDPLRLGQVLINLVNNAVKFTEKGQILVKCRAETLPADVPVAGSQTGQPGLQNVCLHFSVHDTGIGMTPEQCSRLFTAFSQADETTTRKFGGTGLGLSISKKLAEMMGGSIGVKSQADVGSEFYFSWHCRVAAEVTPVKRRLPEGLAGLRVLVVDDNPAARNILYEALREFDFDVDVAASGMEAYAAVQEKDREQPYRIVFTDWNMPGMDGIALIHKIKTNTSLENAPSCVLVTAFGREEIRQKAEQRMTDGFMVKPINQSTLVDTLAKLLSTDLERDAQAYSSTETVPRLNGLRVLLAEDNEINQQIAIELMQSAGVSVDVADNGRIAVDKLKAAEPGTYHLVLMDLQMPHMDGHEATLAIRANPLFKDTPIIAMTAHAMVEERERCLAEGMNDHITKPIDPALLYKTLQQWGGHAVTPDTGDEIAASKPALTPSVVVADIDLERLQATIPTLDLQGALRRVAGNRALYVRLLKRYCAEQSDVLHQIQECLARQDHSAAEILAHTLKGVSSNIGADNVAANAAEIETALRANASQASIEALLNKAAEPLGNLVAELKLWFSLNETAATPSWSGVPLSNDLRSEIAALCHLLDDMDAEAVDRFELLVPNLRHCMEPALIDRIQQQLQGFNFEATQLLLTNFVQAQSAPH